MKISIILPAFNEQNNIKAIYQQLTNVLAGFTYEVIFVDDGSQDNTLAIIKEISQVDSRIRFISFSRNFGHQAALKAGLDAVQGDVLIFMDCDLQHPPALISNYGKKGMRLFIRLEKIINQPHSLNG
jgi:dolichol-phosphate mannosyltransferase